jgi:hypothetical protein
VHFVLKVSLNFLNLRLRRLIPIRPIFLKKDIFDPYIVNDLESNDRSSKIKLTQKHFFAILHIFS